jgi:hypothetical protein
VRHSILNHLTPYTPKTHSLIYAHSLSFSTPSILEADLFFQYTHVVDLDSYQHLQDKENLMVAFGDYPFDVIIRMLTNCQKEPHGAL